MDTQKKHIDWSLAETMAAGNTALATELLYLFVQELPNYRALFNRHYQKKQWAALEALAHKLQGGCCYCGISLLKVCAKRLEKMCSAKSPEAIGLALETLNECIDALLAEAKADPKLQTFSTHQDHKG